MPDDHGEILLELDGIVVLRGGNLAVDHVSLEVRGQEIAALVGPSGCGKTSLLRAIAGLERCASGTVRIAGRVMSSEGCWIPAERRAVGMVFQEGALFPHMTVRDNVRYGVRGQPEERARVAHALDLVGISAVDRRFPDQLSGGQQQLVALARALAPAPRIVLLDEPFANLDAGLRVRLREKVRRILRSARTTAILVTHDQQEALSLADRVAVMQAGRVLQVGAPEEVYNEPATVAVAEFIGGGQLIACSVRRGRLASELGELPTDAPEGEARLLVRPEDLRVLHPDAPDGLEAELLDRRFFGHDLLQEVRLPSGRVVEVRCTGPAPGARGCRVRVALRSGSFPVFRGDDATRYAARLSRSDPSRSGINPA